jgi:hypothetical protein
MRHVCFMTVLLHDHVGKKVNRPVRRKAVKTIAAR